MKSAAKNLVTTRDLTLRQILEGPPIEGFTEQGAATKILFHKLGTAWLKKLALGIGGDPTDVRSNLAGPAVSGEVSLNGRNVYICLSGIVLDRTKDEFLQTVLVRKCKKPFDYGIDSPNRWMPVEYVDPHVFTQAIDFIVDVVAEVVAENEE